MVDRRKRLEPDELVWLIHQEVVKRAGGNKHFAIAVAPIKGGWVIRQPNGGRPLLPEVEAAIVKVEEEFQRLYRLKRTTD